jgi:hypothetical protein
MNIKNEGEAKALHYISRCLRGNDFYRRCTWAIKENDSLYNGKPKAAFTKLHKVYKDSPWTHKTPYYYEQ